MSRSSGRAQVEPVVALVATLVVTAGLGLYAGGVDRHLERVDRRTAEEATTTLAHQTADRVADTARVDGTVRPGRLSAATASAPAGYRVNATLRTRTGRWTAGPPAPEDAVGVERRVTVHLGPGRARPGSLRVWVWR